MALPLIVSGQRKALGRPVSPTETQIHLFMGYLSLAQLYAWKFKADCPNYQPIKECWVPPIYREGQNLPLLSNWWAGTLWVTFPSAFHLFQTSYQALKQYFLVFSGIKSLSWLQVLDHSLSGLKKDVLSPVKDFAMPYGDSWLCVCFEVSQTFLGAIQKPYKCR